MDPGWHGERCVSREDGNLALNIHLASLPRLYHSTAVLLSDGSVAIAGSNPFPDFTLVFSSRTMALNLD
jgi:hypothetical protein